MAVTAKWYQEGVYHVMNGDVDFTANTVKIGLLDNTYTYADADEFWDSGGTGVGTDEETDLGAETKTDSRPAVLTEPRVPIPDRAENYRGEISGPITLPQDGYRKDRKSRARTWSSPAVQIALAVLAILSASLALVFAREPTMKLPTPIGPAVGAVGEELGLKGGGPEVDDPSP